MGFSIDLTDMTPEELEKGQFIGPGWCKVNLDDATENNETGAMELRFKALVHTAGNFTGLTVTEKLKNPDLETDETKAKKANDKAAKWAQRMGAVRPDGFGGKTEPDFISCIGREYVLEMERRSFTGDDGSPRTITSPTYLGVYPLDHEGIPEDVARELALPPARKVDSAGKPTKPRRATATAGRSKRTSAGTTAPATGGNPAAKPAIDVSNL